MAMTRYRNQKTKLSPQASKMATEKYYDLLCSNETGAGDLASAWGISPSELYSLAVERYGEAELARLRAVNAEINRKGR